MLLVRIRPLVDRLRSWGCGPRLSLIGRTKRRWRACPQSGQTLVLFALLMNLVVVGVAAFAVDFAVMHAEQRRLQNAADAAALAGAETFKRTGNATSTIASAQSYVARNTSSNVEMTPPPSLPSGGAEMTHGIDVEQRGVRVALEAGVPAIFSRALGYDTLTIRARAMAGIKPPDSVLPAAVKRFDRGDMDQPIANQSNPKTRKDALCADTESDNELITAWPGGATPDWSAPSSCVAASVAQPGPTVSLIGGNDAKPNSGTSSFRGMVLFEQRQLHTGSTRSCHGYTGSPSTYKGEVEAYTSSYGGFAVSVDCPLPAVGESVAGLPGTNAGTIIAALRKRYREGDLAIAAVYEGKYYGGDYVFIRGWALFKFVGGDSNEIKVRAVSSIYSSANSLALRTGHRVALVAW